MRAWLHRTVSRQSDWAVHMPWLHGGGSELPDMRVAREEVFGPVLCVSPFESEEEAVRVANDTAYGLTNYVQSGDPGRVRRLARALRSGMVQANGAARARGSPFGGYKQSGNGREGGTHGLLEFLEVKAVSGWD